MPKKSAVPFKVGALRRIKATPVTDPAEQALFMQARERAKQARGKKHKATASKIRTRFMS